jgi:hypothetical protein
MKPVSLSAPTAAPTPPAPPARLGKGAQEIAEALAQASGKSVDEILALRQHGRGFGRIARDLGLSLGEIRSGRYTAPAPPAPTEPAPVGDAPADPPVSEPIVSGGAPLEEPEGGVTGDGAVPDAGLPPAGTGGDAPSIVDQFV